MRALDEHAVFGEEGRENDNLFAARQKRVERDRQGSRRPATHIDMIRGNARSELPFEICRNCLAHRGVALRGGIAVKLRRRHFVEQADNFFLYAIGRGRRGIADGKVEHVLLSDFLRPLLAVLKELADRRALLP